MDLSEIPHVQPARVASVFFDLDGTLTDPREGIVRSISHALTSMGHPSPSDKSLAQFIGPPLARTFENLLGTTDHALIRGAIDVYRARFATVGIFENRVYSEIPAALAALRSLGFTLYIVTSKPATYAERISSHFGLDGYFAGIHGPRLDEVDGTKTVLVGRALAIEGFDAAGVIVVGDRRDDLVGARANGTRFVGVTWGYGSEGELDGADHIVDSPSDLVSFLQSAICMAPPERVDDASTS